MFRLPILYFVKLSGKELSTNVFIGENHTLGKDFIIILILRNKYRANCMIFNKYTIGVCQG